VAPDTEKLIGLIEEERERARELAAATEKEIQESDAAFKEVSREIEESREETEEAVETLRRAGLLASV
jgi:hypothetical protein